MNGRWRAVGAMFVVAAAGMAGCPEPVRDCPDGMFRVETGQCAHRCESNATQACDDAGNVIPGIILDAAGFDVQPTCEAGTACSGACVSLDSDPNNCGACGHACAAVANATATCSAGACGFSCNAGFEVVGGACEISVPRQIGPISTSLFHSGSPTFEWLLPSGVNAVRLELCRSRACTSVVRTVDVTGQSHTPTVALSQGVWFWRLRGLVAGVPSSRTTATWEVFIEPRAGAASSPIGARLDLNGDGAVDVAISTDDVTQVNSQVVVYLGNPSAPLAGTTIRLYDPAGASDEGFGYWIANAADTNGDGYGDLLVAAPPTGMLGTAYIFNGGPDGPSDIPTSTIIGYLRSATDYLTIAGGASLALDVNHDGYGDIVLQEHGRISVFAGSLSGIAEPPLAQISSPESSGTFGDSVFGGIDVTGDTTSDIVVSSANDSMGGSVFVFDGTDLEGSPAHRFVAPDPAPSGFANSIDPRGDLDGDGRLDLAVGANQYGSSTGRAYVFLGRGGGAWAPATYFNSRQSASNFGVQVTACDDLQADGRDDLVVSASGELVSTGTTGAVYVFSGSTSGPSDSMVTRIPSPTGRVYFGLETAMTDLNTDGHADILASAWSTPDGWVYFFDTGLEPPATSIHSTSPRGFGGRIVAR